MNIPKGWKRAVFFIKSKYKGHLMKNRSQKRVVTDAAGEKLKKCKSLHHGEPNILMHNSQKDR